MTPERWKDTLANILDNFEVTEHQNDFYEDYGGTDIEYVVFTSPLGKVKLEYVERPLILDKKTLYSNRIGSESNIEYVYSQTEKSHRLNAYKWNSDLDDWEEIDASNFS